MYCSNSFSSTFHVISWKCKFLFGQCMSKRNQTRDRLFKTGRRIQKTFGINNFLIVLHDKMFIKLGDVVYPVGSNFSVFPSVCTTFSKSCANKMFTFLKVYKVLLPNEWNQKFSSHIHRDRLERLQIITSTDLQRKVKYTSSPMLQYGVRACFYTYRVNNIDADGGPDRTILSASTQ